MTLRVARARVEPEDFMDVDEAAGRLGVSPSKLFFLRLNGHVLGVVTANGKEGVHRASVEAEERWRAEAGSWERLKRAFVDVISWIS